MLFVVEKNLSPFEISLKKKKESLVSREKYSLIFSNIVDVEKFLRERARGNNVTRKDVLARRENRNGE